jgi:hypothetical protein
LKAWTSSRRANEIGDDTGLEIRERQDEVGLQGEDLVDIR